MIAERLARRIARSGLAATYVRPTTGEQPHGSWPVAVLLSEGRPTMEAITAKTVEATLAASALPPAIIPAARDSLRIGGKTWTVAARPLGIQVLGQVVAWRLALGDPTIQPNVG